jgi:hypothetical protein
MVLKVMALLLNKYYHVFVYSGFVSWTTLWNTVLISESLCPREIGLE